MDIIAASSIFSRLKPHTNVSANHFLGVFIYVTDTVRILSALSDIYAMINMVKSVFSFTVALLIRESLARVYVIGSDNHNYSTVLNNSKATRTGDSVVEE